jgi:catechol 2,3-dioxygenase-like lactoylglutathione lyase family enzyme
MPETFPRVVQVVLDTTNARALAEFYRQLFGFQYRPGDEPPLADQDDRRGREWLVIRHPSGAPRIAFQQVDSLHHSTWPSNEVPQQLHLDTSVPSKEELERQHTRALQLGATLRFDRSNDPREPLYVYADPDGHPFCIFVSPEGSAG